jgi:hypothetical protein
LIERGAILGERIAAHHILSIGNGDSPICAPAQLGCINVTPLPPQLPHRPLCRRTSLEASAPHRMINGARATGTPRPHARQWTHSQQV